MKLPQLNWIEPTPVTIPEALTHALSLHPIALKALFRRGITSAQQAKSFIDPNAYHLAPPGNLPDLEHAADILLDAIEQKKNIAIWGDFDVDGQTATSLLAQTLTQLGASSQTYIPVRARESHGMNTAGIDWLIANGAQLILTCDTGISAHAEIIYAQERGVDVIITDHHTLPPQLPPASAVVNPQRLPHHHPHFPLCGVGIAYQLACELLSRVGMEDRTHLLLDLVALGTVADVASLTGDNRCLVQAGLNLLQTSPRPALKAMLTLAGVNAPRLNEGHLAFTLAPRLNALGRLSDANPIVPFLLSPDEASAQPLAQELDNLNTRRKLLCDQVFQAAIDQLQRDASLQNDPILILSHPQWPAGVIGIVASRLVELFMRPVILISLPPGQAGRASARSIEGVNITHALAANQHLLMGFGGHAGAAGFSILPENIPAFRRGMARVVTEMMTASPPSFTLAIEDYVNFDQLNLSLVESLEQLAPFGAGNPPIILASRNLRIKSHTNIGKSKEHLQLIVEDPSSTTHKVLWWQGAGSPLPEGKFDLAYSVRSSNYRGQKSAQIEWITYRLADTFALELTASARFEVIDHRLASDPAHLLSGYLSQPGCLIWSEGDNTPPVPGVNRFNLAPIRTLVLWNIPPGRDELRAILQSANPQQVVLFATSPTIDQPQPFLNHLAGLVQFAVRKNQGITSIRQLAAALAQKETTTEKGLAWLTATGLIKVEHREDKIHLAIVNAVPDLQTKKQVESEIDQLLSETRSFRSYFLRAQAAHLLEE